jgi:hypothetical protein
MEADRGYERHRADAADEGYCHGSGEIPNETFCTHEQRRIRREDSRSEECDASSSRYVWRN